MLAFEENKHRELLEKFYEVLFQEDQMKIPDGTDEALLPSIHFTPSSSLVEILHQAMESEKSAEIFYARLAERFENPQKKILEYLSIVEHSPLHDAQERVCSCPGI